MLPQNSGPAVLFLVGGVNTQSLDGVNRPQQLIVFLQVFVIVAVLVFVIGFLIFAAGLDIVVFQRVFQLSFADRQTVDVKQFDLGRLDSGSMPLAWIERPEGV